MEGIPAQPEQVRMLLEYASVDTVDRVLATGASIEEIMDAIQLVDLHGTWADTAATARVLSLCDILLDAKRPVNADVEWRPAG